MTPRLGRRRRFTNEEISRATAEHGPGRSWEAIATDLGRPGLGMSLKRRSQEFRAGAKLATVPAGSPVVRIPDGALLEHDPLSEIRVRLGRIEAEVARLAVEALPDDLFDEPADEDPPVSDDGSPPSIEPADPNPAPSESQERP